MRGKWEEQIREQNKMRVGERMKRTEGSKRVASVAAV